MNKQDILIVLLWVVLMIAFIIGALFIKDILLALGDIVVAVIAGIVTLTAAILTHALTISKEQESRKVMEKQKNYLKIIDNLERVIRNESNPDDVFSKIHIESWVVASSEVVSLTNKLMGAQDADSRRNYLIKLLEQMREELGMDKVDSLIKLEHVFKPIGGI